MRCATVSPATSQRPPRDLHVTWPGAPLEGAAGPSPNPTAAPPPHQVLLVSADLSQNVALLKEATHQVMRTEGDGFPLFAVKVVHARDGCAVPPPPPPSTPPPPPLPPPPPPRDRHRHHRCHHRHRCAHRTSTITTAAASCCCQVRLLDVSVSDGDGRGERPRARRRAAGRREDGAGRSL